MGMVAEKLEKERIIHAVKTPLCHYGK